MMTSTGIQESNTSPAETGRVLQPRLNQMTLFVGIAFLTTALGSNLVIHHHTRKQLGRFVWTEESSRDWLGMPLSRNSFTLKRDKLMHLLHCQLIIHRMHLNPIR